MRNYIVILAFFTCGFVQGQGNSLDFITDELKISDSIILKQLYSEKKLPYKKHSYIHVIPVISKTVSYTVSDSNEKEESYTVDLHIAELNSLTNTISRHYVLEDEFQTDATGPRQITIDTAPYHVKNNSRALALRIEHYSSSWEWFARESFILLEPVDHSYNEILRTDGRSKHVIYRSNCEFDYIEETKLFIIDKSQIINGYYPIEVKGTYVQQLADSNCVYTINKHAATGQFIFIDSSYSSYIKLPNKWNIFPTNKK